MHGRVPEPGVKVTVLYIPHYIAEFFEEYEESQTMLLVLPVLHVVS